MSKDETFRIGLEVKAKHGALLAALEKRGWNQRQGAKFLGIDQGSFGKLINMKKVPKRLSEKLATKLFELTGQLPEELWPEEVFTEEFLAAPKHLRSFRRIPVHLLAAAGMVPALPPSTPEELYQRTELFETLHDALRTLSPREQKIIQGRFIEGKTLEEMEGEIGVTAGRIQQIKSKALRHLRQPSPETHKLRKLLFS